MHKGSDINSSKSAGGKARAKSLSKEERSEIARRAASARWGEGAFRATHIGELALAGIKIPCAVLEDGRRLISVTGLANAFGSKPGGWAYKNKSNEGADLPLFVRVSGLKPYISEELAESLSNPIQYRPVNGGPIASGHPATILAQICDAWLDARATETLTAPQAARAKKAEILMRSFAKIGIEALVDEATGYQEIRDRDALQKLLEIYISKELQAWTQRFPMDFYREIFRLRDWEWMGMEKNRPQCVANYTKDFVYERLAPGILKELETKNPKDDKGNRSAKHHQWLSNEVGHPALAQHLHAVITLMKASDNWDTFRRLLNRSLPKKGDTLEMPID